MTGMTSPLRSQALTRLAAVLTQALERDPLAAGRLVYARTTVGFCVDGSADRVALMLDGAVPRVETNAVQTDVEIELTEPQLERFTRGELSLSVAVGRGDVLAHGPARPYLQVDPILQALLAGGHTHRQPLEPSASTTAPNVDPDLLAIQMQGLEKSFGPQQVLRGLSLDIPEGVISVVLGPSGTGKSVLLSHILGLMRPDAGRVIIRGQDLAKLKRAALFEMRETIGVMFQDGALLGTMNVYDNVAFPLRQHTDLTEAEVGEVVMEQLSAVGLVAAAGRMPGELSGGMRKRAGLARALVMDPGILLCDEPDSGLDPVRTALLADLLLEQHDRMGGTVLVVTHNIRLAKHIADHVSVMWQGQAVASGFAEDVLALDNPFVRQFLAGDSAGPLTMD